MPAFSTITKSSVLPTFRLQNFRPSAVLLQGDSALRLKAIRSNRIGAVVCDPPYDLAYANNDWDRALPDIAIWKECLRVLKPGGYLVAFGSPKTSHRLTMQLEDVGFILGGRLVWECPNGTPACQRIGDTHHARVKPAHEDIILVMKPIAAKTMKSHRELHGIGGLRVVDTLGDGTIKITTSILKHNKPTPTERNLGVEHFPIPPFLQLRHGDDVANRAFVAADVGDVVKVFARPRMNRDVFLRDVLVIPKVLFDGLPSDAGRVIL